MKGDVKMGKVFCVLGIALVMIGTILSLWSVLSTKTKDYFTVGWYNNQNKEFKKTKIMVVIGTILIIAGSIFQIIGTLI